MKIVIVNKSDSTGGAAVVSFRLMMALRSIGADARMLVAEKLTDSPYVAVAASSLKLKFSFIADRLRIALSNGFDRSTLFKMDAAVAGVNISEHPWIKEADAVFLNWINQGLLSLKDIERLGKSGKRIVWTMHDMWNMTGICHHAGECRRYVAPGNCGDCPLLGSRASANDLSRSVWLRKNRLYESIKIDFVAVSSWLSQKAAESSLLADRKIHVIPNPFSLPASEEIKRDENPGKIRLIFGAARIDDDIKDFPTFIRVLQIIEEREPDTAKIIEVNLYGAIRDEKLIEQIPVKVNWHGMLRNNSQIVSLYEKSDIVVSTSLFETLPGTLVEGQAYGCLPVAFGRGGQRDIIDDGSTGIIVEWHPDREERSERMASAILRAARMSAREGKELKERMYRSVSRRFDAETVARSYLNLLND